ncbi:hypothetical protein RJ639_020783 [Escallonia herrerae]|uniref:RNase H type-1 domain-containing protein n=1 Tax=Escallonia herrerae TaxID=1293975 RepID=A0AA88V303_9ASTE|nr:hypothetical protein RJ639_020783 [Escallonia herrerae]
MPKEISVAALFPPSSGYTNLNFDAFFVDQCGSGRIGLVLRNETGLFLAARTIHLPHCLNARTAEALAAREVLNLASEMHVSHIIIESDSCGIISFVDTKELLPPEIEVIILDCRHLKHQFQKTCFDFRPRTGNRSTHVEKFRWVKLIMKRSKLVQTLLNSQNKVEPHHRAGREKT